MAAFVTLIDGSEAPSDSQAWRDECLARRVLAMAPGPRSHWLADFEARHGRDVSEQLRELMAAVGEAHTAALPAGVTTRERRRPRE